ncbi:MAG: DsrE/DsrF/DrsH-like family protein [Myxococcales bacterium]|nr:DsrE/DsrF/DrsH-like family protein [Myxococcales bacterium]
MTTTIDTTDSAHTVDCRGMQCPAPILRLAETARKLKESGGSIVVLATDEDFPMDLEAWCRSSKATVASLTRDGNVIRATVTLAGTKPALAPPTRPAPTPAPTASAQAGTTASSASPFVIDACGLTAVQVVKKLSEAASADVTALRVIADAPGVDAKILSWASATEADVESVRREKGRVMIDLRLPSSDGEEVEFVAPSRAKAPVPAHSDAPSTPIAEKATAVAPSDSTALATVDDGAARRENRMTLLVLKNDLEGLLAAMMSANAAAAQGMKVDVFFSFWAVHLLRGERPRANAPEEPVGFIGRMMKLMVPSGAKRQQLAKLRMGGMGTRLLNWLMRKRNILSLDQLIEQAVKQDVRFVVCSMSMGLMGLTKRDIVDLPNVEFAGVASFVEHSRRSSVALVF